MEQGVGRLGKTVERTRRKLGNYQQKHAALGRRIRLTGDAMGKLTARHGQLARAVDWTRKRLDRYQDSLRRTQADLGRAQRIEHARARLAGRGRRPERLSGASTPPTG